MRPVLRDRARVAFLSLEDSMPPKKAVQPRDVPVAKNGKPLTAKRHHVRAIGVGYANETLYEADAEFMLVVYDGITPPKWVDILDEGVSVDPAGLPLPADIMAADPVKSVKAGFAASLAATGGGEVI